MKIHEIKDGAFQIVAEFEHDFQESSMNLSSCQHYCCLKVCVFVSICIWLCFLFLGGRDRSSDAAPPVIRCRAEVCDSASTEFERRLSRQCQGEKDCRRLHMTGSSHKMMSFNLMFERNAYSCVASAFRDIHALPVLLGRNMCFRLFFFLWTLYRQM